MFLFCISIMISNIEHLFMFSLAVVTTLFNQHFKSGSQNAEPKFTKRN